MVATTTVSKNLLNNLRRDFPDITFAPSEEFRWSPSTNTVFYAGTHSDDLPLLLHETAHGVLGHTGYVYDIDLVKLERDAWSKAQELGERYGVIIDEGTVEDALDTYRDWLHSRSLCPACQQNGAQTAPETYSCVPCGLRRTLI